MGHPSIMSLERLRRIVANFRLRDRSKGMDASLPVKAPEASVDGVVQLMTACAGLVKSASSSSAVSQAEPPRLRLFSKSPDPKGSSSLLAIKDKEENAEGVPGDLAPTGTGAKTAPTPAQTISALKTGLSSKEKEESQRMARPAAAKSSLKRPHTHLHTHTLSHTEATTQRLLHTDAFTHRRFCTQTVLRRHFYTNAFTHRRFYTQTLLHTDTFTHRHFYTKKPLHTEAFTHRRSYTEAFTHRLLYTQTLLHTEAFTHRHFYTQTLLHTEAFT